MKLMEFFFRIFPFVYRIFWNIFPFKIHTLYFFCLAEWFIWPLYCNIFFLIWTCALVIDRSFLFFFFGFRCKDLFVLLCNVCDDEDEKWTKRNKMRERLLHKILLILTFSQIVGFFYFQVICLCEINAYPCHRCCCNESILKCHIICEYVWFVCVCVFGYFGVRFNQIL